MYVFQKWSFRYNLKFVNKTWSWKNILRRRICNAYLGTCWCLKRERRTGTNRPTSKQRIWVTEVVSNFMLARLPLCGGRQLWLSLDKTEPGLRVTRDTSAVSYQDLHVLGGQTVWSMKSGHPRQWVEYLQVSLKTSKSEHLLSWNI